MNRVFNVYADSFKGLSVESWMLSIVMLINRTGSMVLPFMGIYMTEKLNFGIEVSGGILACFGIGSVIGSWLGGYLTDKIGEYYIQAFSLFASVPLFCLYPFFTTPFALSIVVLIQSIISELFRPANSVAVAKYARPDNLTRAFSLNRMAINLGFSLGPVIGGLLSTISYNFLFYTNSITVLISGLFYVYFFNRRQKLFRIKQYRLKRDSPGSTLPFPSELSPYKDFKFIIFCLICTFFSICFFQLMSSLPLFYKNELGLSKLNIGLLMGANGIVVVLFEMLLVHIADRWWTLAKTMLYGTLLCALSYFMLGFNPNYFVLFASMSLLSLGEILVLPFMATITALRSGERNKGIYMGVNGMAFSVALVFAPILGTKFATTLGFSYMWISISFILLLCSICFYFIVKKMVSPSKTAHNIK